MYSSFITFEQFFKLVITNLGRLYEYDIHLALIR